MRLSLIALLATLLAATSLSACSRTQAPPPVRVAPELVVRAYFDDDGLLVRHFDTDGDGIPDVVKFFQPLDENSEEIVDVSGLSPSRVQRTRLVRAEFDLNHDGNKDMVRHYDARERLRREEIDSRHLGHRGVVSHFESGVIVRREVDVNGNGTADEVHFFTDGERSRIEFDDNGDGRTNRWHFFDNGILVRIGHDRTGDGVIDERQILQVTTRTRD